MSLPNLRLMLEFFFTQGSSSMLGDFCPLHTERVSNGCVRSMVSSRAEPKKRKGARGLIGKWVNNQ